MSLQLISRSPDLKQLRDEGYEIEVNGGHLVVHQIPYVNGSDFNVDTEQ
jgi:biotin operon repressor